MVLLSTVVAPAFRAGTLRLTPVEITPGLLARVSRNLCGHPATDSVLRELHPGLPPAERGFWDGVETGLAIRPRGGVRGARVTGDTPVTLDSLEAVLVEWEPAD